MHAQKQVVKVLNKPTLNLSYWGLKNLKFLMLSGIVDPLFWCGHLTYWHVSWIEPYAVGVCVMMANDLVD